MLKKYVAITTGDLDGIGLEVTMKALRSKGVKNNIYFVYREPKPPKKAWTPISRSKQLHVSSLEEAYSVAKTQGKKEGPVIIEILSEESPALWVKEATLAAKNNLIDGLVTGPVSKKTFINSGLNCVGHTPLLKTLCKANDVYMGFLGQHFNVILVTGHIALHKVQETLTAKNLERAFQTISHWQLKHRIKPFIKPLGILGLNPHNGEDGLIGDFEERVLYPILSNHSGIKGPLVPDAAFHSSQWKKYSFYVALYHDQGLIPFKMIHGHQGGAHTTIGLPIVRTSVDHGTATDIFGKDKAQPESMIDALRWCDILMKKKG